jgi:hypothetical protein
MESMSVTLSFSNKDEYSLNIIEKNKSLVDSLQDLIFSKFKSDHYTKKLTLSCIKKINGLNLLVVDKEFLGSNYYLISALEELSKKDRKIIILFAFEGISNERIDDVEDGL